MLQFRAAKFDDLWRIMEIIKQAQGYFKEQGIDQWQNGYPNPTVIKQDIEKKQSYVLAKNQFSYCGIIYLTDDSKRLAFEKILR